MGKYESNRETRRRKAKNTLPLWVIIPILITTVLCVVTLWAIFDSRQTPPEETRPATEASAPSTEVNTDPPAEQTTVSPVETTEPPAETTVQTEPSIRDSEAYQKLLTAEKADQFDESVLEAFAQWIEGEKNFLDTYPEKWELERLYTGTVSLTCFTPMTEDYHRTLCSVYYDGEKVFVNTIIDRHYTDVPRETVAAMEAGDNILLFPENSANTEDHKYVKEGISEFFTGFTMIGQMYAGRTGKCPLFVPLYADRRKRTITFGTPTRYNVDVSPNDEKERLCRDLRAEILRLAGIDAPQAAGE